MTWRYIAQRIAGPGAGEFLHWNLPLVDVQLTTGIGPWWFEARISNSTPDFTDDQGAKLLVPWNTAIWAEENGVVRGGGILAAQPYRNGRMIKTVGYASYGHGLIYQQFAEYINADPLDIYRHLWAYIKQETALDDVEVDDTKSTQRLGKPPGTVKFTTGDGTEVEFYSNDGPYRLEWWESPNVGETMNWLLSYTPAEIEEQHYWSGDILKHRIHIGTPTVGRRREDLRFALGENITKMPEVVDSYEDYANHIIAHGVGEGKAMLRTEVFGETNKLQRTAVIVRPAIKTKQELTTLARKELHKRQLGPRVESLEVRDHLNARLAGIRGGDEIYLQLDLPTGKISQWRRVMTKTYSPDRPDQATLTLGDPHV